MRRLWPFILLCILAVPANSTPRDPPSNKAIESSWSALSPLARFDHAAIYDSKRERMIVFGGADGARRNDTWEFPLKGKPGWNRIYTQGEVPPAFDSFEAAYDPVRDRMLVLMGHTTNFPDGRVFSLSLSGQPRWTILDVEGVPAPNGQVVYDPIRDRFLDVYGGEGDTLRAGVYALTFDGEAKARWTRLPVQMPSALRRVRFALAHDLARDRILLFGGGVGARGSFESPYRPLNDTWELPLADTLEWRELSPSGDLPLPRLDAFAVFDEKRDRMVVWSGSPEPGFSPFLGDSWALSLGDHPAWSKLAAEIHPAPERDSQIYDPDRDRMIIFGGVVNQPAALSYGPVVPTVRSLALADGREWETLFPSDPIPEVAPGQTLTYDPVGRRFILLGGFRSTDVVWTYELRGQGGWRAVTTTGEIPPQRLSQTAIYDPVSKSIVMFGGAGLPTRFNDTWRLSLGDRLSWTRLAPLGDPPSPRSQPRSVYDPIGGRLILYGGLTDAGPVNDVWELSLTSDSRWTSRSPAGTPPGPDIPPAFVYDSNRHRALLVGQDVWALDLDPELRWERVDAPSGPFVTGNSASFDASGDRALAILAGDKCQPWILDLSPTVAWHQVPVAGDTPSSRGSTAIGFGPEGTGAYVFGNNFSFRFGDLWQLEMKESSSRARSDLRTGVELADAAPTAFALAAPDPNPSAGPMNFSFTLPRDANVSVRVFDTAGRLVSTLFNGMSEAGSREVLWDGRDELGAAVRSGVYFCRLTAGARSETKQFVFLGR